MSNPPSWKARALRLLAANKARYGRLKTGDVARQVGKARMTVYRLLRDKRDEHDHSNRSIVI